MPFADLYWGHGGQIGRRVYAVVDQIAHCRREHKVASLKDNGLMVAERNAATPLQNRAIEWFTCRLATNSPRAGAFHQLRQAGGGLEQSNDFRKRIDGHFQD